MKLGYKYYRNNLIKLAILSVAIIPVFWAHLHGTGKPGALILIAVLMVIGNVGLFIAMRRAKRREQAEALQTKISDETKPVA
jgi:hypothetical protein